MPAPASVGDHVRHHRARKEIHTERDRLLKRADRVTQIKQLLPDDSKDRARAVLMSFPMSLGAMVSYVIMIFFWFRIYHFSFAAGFIAFTMLLFSAGLMCVCSESKLMGRERPWLFWLGILFGAATLVGLLVGAYLYFQHVAYYWRLEEMRTYTNVAPAQSPSEFRDGGLFLWSDDTRLDIMRSVGYKSRWTGQTYCVAPIVDNSMSDAMDVNFWAVGMNCCGTRADFSCNSAGDASVKSAMTLLEPEDLARPFMKWAARPPVAPRYERALKLQQATYFTRSASKPKLVIWTKDPVGMRKSFYNEARTQCIWISIIIFILMLVAANFICWRIKKGELKHTIVR